MTLSVPRRLDALAVSDIGPSFPSQMPVLVLVGEHDEATPPHRMVPRELRAGPARNAASEGHFGVARTYPSLSRPEISGCDRRYAWRRHKQTITADRFRGGNRDSWLTNWAKRQRICIRRCDPKWL